MLYLFADWESNLIPEILFSSGESFIFVGDKTNNPKI